MGRLRLDCGCCARKIKRKQINYEKRKIYEVNWDKVPSVFIHLLLFHIYTTDNTSQFKY
jgi:hypothetical protein